MRSQDVNPYDLSQQVQADRERHPRRRAVRYYHHSDPASKAVLDVVATKKRYETYWRDRPNWRWFMHFMQEVGELTLALLGLHRHSPDVELTEIASIAMNWLEMREEE